MLQYIVRRLLSAIPTIIGVALVTFIIFNAVMGDPCLTMVGKHANAMVLQECHATYGFDRPLPIQFLDYLRQIVTFDYGISNATKQPISQIILNGIGPSLTLAIPAFFATIFLAVIIALLSAYFRRGIIDTVMTEACISGMSISQLFLILVGQYVLAFQWGLFPVSGFEREFPLALAYVALPALIWVLVGLGYEVRFFRTSILAETLQDYVRTARAKGLDERRIYLKHVFKNSMLPIITSVVVEIPMLIMGSLLLERFFAIPGLGSIMIEALNSQDFPVIRAVTTFVSVLYIFGNLLTDVLYAVIDPRVSLK